MQYVDFGKTGMRVSRTSFGALPLQRVTFDEAAALLRRAYEGGINLFDTAHVYSDSEEKIAYALSDVRKHIYIATKSGATDAEVFKRQIELSLTRLKTDYIDLFQFHNAKVTVSDALYAVAQDYKSQGILRHIGATFHNRTLAEEAVDSGRFESLQFPFSGLSDDTDLALTRRAADAGMGFLAMKAMAGGLIRHVEANFAYIRKFPHIVPIWGVQRMEELEQFLSLESAPPDLSPALEAELLADRAELSHRFCRGCGYCKPCPAGITLDFACRMDLFLSRAVWQDYVTPEWRENMARVEQCVSCDACLSRCPYGLRPKDLVREQYKHYLRFLESHADALR